MNIESLLNQSFEQYGTLMYFLIGLAIFAQTANPVGAILPGNMLVFTCGLISQKSTLIQPGLLAVIMIVGAFLGNLVGFWSGEKLGPKIFSKPKYSKHQPKLHALFEKHGPRAVSLAFFIPFVRCLLPISAGAAKMPWSKFVIWSLVGSITWIVIWGVTGYYLGQIPAVRQNLEVGMLVIFVLVTGKIIFEARKASIAS